MQSDDRVMSDPGRDAQIRRQLETISALYTSARRLSESLDLQQLAEDVVRSCVETFGVRLAWLGRAEPDGSVRLLAHFPLEIDYPKRISPRWDDSPLGQGPTGRALRTGSPVVINDIASDPGFPAWRATALAQGFNCAGAFPLISRNTPFGGMYLYSDQQGFFTPERVEFFQAYAHQLGTAFENARLFEEAGRRLEQLQALRDIDVAISASLDLRVTLYVFLDKVVNQLKVDAADVLLFDARTQILEVAAGRGFRTGFLQHTRRRVGEGPAGRAVLERRSIAILKLSEALGAFLRASVLAHEGFVAYYAVPLIAKGQVKGVLEIFSRKPMAPESGWTDFLEALAGQAAIAIDNAALFNELQRTNIELTLAYDTTLEGWSRALELRDMETEGHTQRVTELTMRLARAMGMSEDDLVHVRRGALLHDIGKMGIPDAILLKPGPLSDDEREVIHRHPIYAYELLLPITYLRPALDIPHYHHEEWDGTGYPRGLMGEQIPLAARIFAVADVWDALRSDRPYHPAWTDERAREYLRTQAGTRFDPRVVEAFLGLDLDLPPERARASQSTARSQA